MLSVCRPRPASHAHCRHRHISELICEINSGKFRLEEAWCREGAGEALHPHLTEGGSGESRISPLNGAPAEN